MNTATTPPRVVITGGSSGIGAATCQALLSAGYEVINVSRRPAAIQSERLRDVTVDLTDAAATKMVFAALAAEAPATTLIHCAGVTREKLLEEVSLEDIDALASLHLAAAVSLVQANLPAMKAAGFGRIVLVSTRAVLGLAKRTVYSATKAGMISLARTWALELAAHGITSNVVAPGPIGDTEMFHQIVPRGSAKLDSVTKSIPVGRLGTPVDVARAILFFASPEASFVTGQTLFVCGGTSVGSISF
ncbi:SDR family NAD(P)-dependent oxidoreductase [Steroidobacter sp.]|uniref:SDR family NAD(P)-dependent oxidoreductase n=1 Tax=Steroidobacter sp. TaxID=1978227 RepID=UPI001A52B4AD|nr:SDR family NAD(P)-dependent oxidoreductase [Steroidobacter sp.]MBL8268441.1 SDR family oxidoreductase [Steroidobacter sp.]